MATQDTKLAWLQQVLGVGQAQASGSTPGTTRQPARKISASDFTEEVTKQGDKAAEHFLSGEVAELKKLGLDTSRLQKDQQFQQKALKAAMALPEGAERTAAMERIRLRLEELQEHAEALKTATEAVMASAKGKPSAAQKSAIYQKALEDHYGLAITVPAGMSNTHFDRVFDMMGTVPKSQVEHGKLKKLTYDKTADWKGSGAYGGAEVLMGDFGRAKGAENYEVDGKVLPANSFDVTMLHEMGHALDDAGAA